MINTVLARPQSIGDTLAACLAIFVRDARIAFSYQLNFWLQWVTVLFSVGVSYFLGRLIAPSAAFGVGGHTESYFDYVAINIAFLRFQQTALQSFAQAVRESQTAGTLEAILVTPVKLPVFVLAAGQWAFFNTALQTVAYIILSLPFGLDVHRADLVSVAVFFALTILCIAPLGVIAAAAVIMFKQIGPFEFFITGMSNVFGGVYFPVAMLPLPLQIIGWLLPITHALNGLRGALHGSTLMQLSSDALWLSAATAILLPLSLAFFAAAVKRAKLDGTLGGY
jgi:ABC-2 type transport system permease protein